MRGIKLARTYTPHSHLRRRHLNIALSELIYLAN
jgi:hypothetical protein